MAKHTQERRAALRETLVDIAERRITEDGLRNLRTRDLAREAGCALGAIYNAVGDLKEIELAVNARTFARLGAFVREAAPQDTAPVDQLIAMAHAYHRFAARNHNTWRALFDIERAPGTAAPDWYLTEMAGLFALIHAPLSDHLSDETDVDLALLTRALFSAVHGIVLLSLDEASAGIPASEIDKMLEMVLRRLT